MILNLKRLRLVPATLEMIEAEIINPNQLALLLDVQNPYNWPPPLNDQNSQDFYLSFIKDNPGQLGWGMWYFILKNKSDNMDIIIGNGGFKGTPDKKGKVEIGYSITELYHGRGFATEAAAGLIDWAFSHKDVKKVIAHTLISRRPSIRVLEKNNFLLSGNTDQNGIIRYELSKKNYN